MRATSLHWNTNQDRVLIQDQLTHKKQTPQRKRTVKQTTDFRITTKFNLPIKCSFAPTPLSNTFIKDNHIK